MSRFRVQHTQIEEIVVFDGTAAELAKAIESGELRDGQRVSHYGVPGVAPVAVELIDEPEDEAAVRAEPSSGSSFELPASDSEPPAPVPEPVKLADSQPVEPLPEPEAAPTV